MFDAATSRSLFADPDAARQWFSWGTVTANPSGDQKSVRFDDEDGSPHPLGAQVDVKLHPSGIELPCRVASQCAGNGESEWHPLGPNDEVFVAIPGGNERSGGVIVGRGNQTYDVFPRQVAGMDATQNNFAFKRLRVGYVVESATSVGLSVATTGSQLLLDPNGNCWFKDGNGNLLAMTADALTLGAADTAGDIQVGLQADPAKKVLTLIADSSALILGKVDSSIQTSGLLRLSTAGNAALNHATSIEAVANILVAELIVLAAALTALGPAPLTGPSLAAVLTTLATAGFPGVISAAAALPLSPLNAAAIQAGLAIPSAPGKPGLGAPGLMI